MKHVVIAEVVGLEITRWAPEVRAVQRADESSGKLERRKVVLIMMIMIL